MMIELAASVPRAAEVATGPCEVVPLELSLETMLEGATKLVFLRTGLMSFQVTPPSEVDSKRPSLEEAQPWATSLKLTLSRPAPLGIAGH